MDEVRRMRTVGEGIIHRMDASFETLLAEYVAGPRTTEAYRALSIKADALANIRARGEWMEWYYKKQICDGVLVCVTCLLYVPCAIDHVYVSGTWKDHDAWRANHPRPANWNLALRIQPNVTP